MYRADVFAGSVLALHARNRLLHRARIVHRTDIVAIHPDPMHFASAEHLIFSNGRNVILGLARHDAGVAASTGAQIDRHAPLQTFPFKLRINGVELGNLVHLIDDFAFFLYSSMVVSRTSGRVFGLMLASICGSSMEPCS